MTNETRRRQLREKLIATAKEMQEADRQRRLETLKKISGVRRGLKGPYSPEAFAAEIRNLFGSNRRNTKIG